MGEKMRVHVAGLDAVTHGLVFVYARKQGVSSAEMMGRLIRKGLEAQDEGVAAILG